MRKCLILACLIAVTVAAPSFAFGYGRSETEEMKEDVREALNRARDFSAQKVREATEDLKRERGAKEVKKERAEFEAALERARIEYVRERNARPSEALTQARMERAYEEKQLIADRAMDKARAEYKLKRMKVQHIIDTKAYIDEAQEFGL